MRTTIYDLVDELNNENERPVIDLVFQYQVEDRLPCECRECFLDITVLALNALKSRYCVAFLKKFYVDEEDVIKFDNDMKQAVEDACKIVEARPHHLGVSRGSPPTMETLGEEAEPTTSV